VLSIDRKLIAANDLFVDLIPFSVINGIDRVRLQDIGADNLLVGALDRVFRGPSTPTPHSIPVAKSHRRPSFVLHIVPVRRTANDVLHGSSCFLVATTVGRKGMPASAEIIGALFDLTEAEARVAREIAAGSSPDEIAGHSGVSVGTIRNQLKAVFAKTGSSRQCDLALLIGTLSL
jgi:DNA-binding CsgD family transcriptional regulator